MSKPPARGIKAGVQADLQAAKDGGAGYTSGTGTTAWSHDFLNKKPWHPSNFKNQMRKFEAEQEVELKNKREESAKAEFEAEQRYLDTLAHLPSKDADKYRQRQSVAWMYLKPPGLSAWEEKAQQQQNADKAAAANPDKQPPGAKRAPARPDAAVDRKGFVAAPGGGADASGDRWSLNLKRKERSPPRGGFTWSDANQQFLDGQSDDESAGHAAQSSPPIKRHKKERKKERRKAKTEDKAFKKALKLLLKEGVPAEALQARLQESAAAPSQ